MHKIFNILLCCIVCYQYIFSQKDSVSIRLPKHYFNTIILLDYYQKPEITLIAEGYTREKLKSYQIKQGTMAFSIPFYTKDIIKQDSSIANINFLFTGYFLSYYPNFSGLATTHILKKNGIGIRFIYNNGKKSIFFVDFSPFVTKDKNYDDTKIFRIASLLLWSYSPSASFNFRLGLTKSFMWGNRYYLPFIGIRIGAYDKVNFSFQFPRIMSLNFPIHQRFQISLFTKPQGGLFTISNNDTIYTKNLNENTFLYLGRYEFLAGIRIDVLPFKWLGIYMAVGSSANNYLALYSRTYNRNMKVDYAPFFQNKVSRYPFFNIGITGYFGKTKSYYERQNIDNMIHLNNEMGVGDNNIPVYQNTDNFKKKEKFKVDNKELSDLINTFDY